MRLWLVELGLWVLTFDPVFGEKVFDFYCLVGGAGTLDSCRMSLDFGLYLEVFYFKPPCLQQINREKK